MKLVHIDAISAVLGIAILAGVIWLLLATLNPAR